MENTRIIELLKTFSEKEMNGMSDFVASGYFNQNENVVKLFSILKKYYPEFESEMLSKEKVFLKIFGKNKYNDEKMRTLISNLTKLCKKYLIQIDIESKGEGINLHLLTQLRLRNQKTLFTYEYNKINSSLNESKSKEREYYSVKYLMETELYQSDPTAIKDAYLEKPLIENVAYNFERLFLIDLLDINYNMLTRKSKVNYSPDFLFLEAVRLKIENGGYSDTPVIPLKYYIFMSVQNPFQEEYFEKAEKIYFDNLDLISPIEKAYINTGLVNYCWLRVGLGDEKYFRRVFDVYKIGLDEGMYFYENKFLLTSLFNGIVKCACFLKELQWLFNFIYEYKNKLDPEVRKEAMNVAYSKYYFEKKEFDSALKHISKINASSSILKLEIKILTIKILYELGYAESVYSSIDSLKHFFRNNKLLHASILEQIKSFSKIVKKLSDLKEKNNKDELTYFKKQVADSPELGMISIRWVIEKIDELIK